MNPTVDARDRDESTVHSFKVVCLMEQTIKEVEITIDIRATLWIHQKALQGLRIGAKYLDGGGQVQRRYQ